MPKGLAVVIPGILGSVLYHPGTPKDFELWGEYIRDNYDRLIHQPGILSWNGTAAHSRLLDTMYASRKIPLPKAIYRKLLHFLQHDSQYGHADLLKCSYDWRDSIFNSCETVVNGIQERYESRLSNKPLSGEQQIAFFTHSLGGLVLRAAVAGGKINPARISRVIHIGTPLQGSPAAFRTAFSRSDLPWFSELFSFFNCLHLQKFKTLLLEAFRTFPSLYQLMPHRDIKYLYYSPISRENPLDEPYIEQEKRQEALRAQECVRIADRILFEERIPTFTIYTAVCPTARTDHAYRVEALARPKGYRIIGTYFSDFDGDGTVPSYSAMGSELSRRVPVVRCRHATLCNSDAVINAILAILTDAALETKA